MFYFLFFGFDESVWTLTSIFMRGLRKVLTRLLTRVFMRVLTRVFMIVLTRVLTRALTRVLKRVLTRVLMRVLQSRVYFNNIVAHTVLYYEPRFSPFFHFL